ncbi:hypothetical protein [Streptomyces naphthomycinicus]|uniref:hypothetical protein n=1 Tax=Streptomyces naphthomycinicus TaxID=2872625 RepID=UPI001CED95C0|nr:hypothetical protein [Streptomyces sp. TML10]
MPDRTSDPGAGRRPAEGPAGDERRFAEGRPGDEGMSEEERMTRRESWPEERTEPRPEERTESRPGERLESRSGERLTGEAAPAERPGRLRGSAGPGREGLTGDDRAPEDTAPAPGAHGTEGLRPGTEDLGSGVDEGFTASHRAEWSAISEEDRMPANGLGAPAPDQDTGREAASTDSPGRDAWPTAFGTAAPAAPLLPREESEQWERRIRETVGAFVEEPAAAVEQADRALEEIAARFSEAVTRRRRTLRMSWESGEADTEQLRLALRDYRELAGRLLRG